MKALIAALALALLAFPSLALAYNTQTFHQSDVTKAAPMTVVITTDAPGQLSATAMVYSHAATFTVTGPASLSCEQGVKGDGTAALCYFPTAPIGTYTLTVTPKGPALSDIFMYVSGEFPA